MTILKPEFVEIKTRDGLTLPGLFYAAQKPKAVAIYLHGNGSASVFYNESKNHPLAAALARQRTSILYFNNRGAHVIKRLSVGTGQKRPRRNYGMAYEKIKESIPDIDGAISFLKKRGYRKFYLIGLSTGANKICVYNYYKPKNVFSKYVLLCPGDDVGIYYDTFGKEKFLKLLTVAKQKIKKKHGQELIPDIVSQAVFSYAGFYDIANPDGDYNVFPFLEVIRQMRLSRKPLFRYFKSIKKPSLVVYGSQDEYAWGDVKRAVNILKKKQPVFTYKVISGADHGFHGYEKKLATIITHWLEE